MMKKVLTIFFVTAAVVIPSIVNADVWQERELLERWVAQTESLGEIIDAAESTADSHRRSQMNYSMLRQEMDLTVMKVKHYLTSPTIPFNEFQSNAIRNAEEEKTESIPVNQGNASDMPPRGNKDAN